MRTDQSPPLGARLKYELFGARLPEAYLPWADQDIARRTWPPGFFGPFVLVLLVITVGEVIGGRTPSIWPVVGFGVAALVLRFSPFGRRLLERRRRYSLEHQRGAVRFGAHLRWPDVAVAIAIGAAVVLVLTLLGD